MDRLEEAVKQLATVLGAKHDTAGAPTTTGFAHGSGGLWSLAGQNPRVWSAMVGLKSLATQIPSFRTTVTHPLQSYFTGVLAESGENPDSLCDDGPTAGLSKAATIVRQFGKYTKQTAELNLNRLGQVLYGNNGDPMNLALMNQPDQGGNIFPTFGGNANLSRSINAEIAKRFFEMQMAFARTLATQLYTGTPANNTPLLGYPDNFYAEFSGLQLLVNTGYRDTFSGVAAPSLDSDVKNFNNNRIDLVPTLLVTYLAAMWRYLNWKADSQGISGVEWAFVMRPAAFWAATDAWPCAYNTVGCTTAAGATPFVDATSQKRFADDMRQGRYLMIDGERIPVILDSYLPETSANGVFTSDIYLLPLNAMGVPTTYWEYFDEGNDQIAQAINMIDGGGVFTSDDNAYIVWSKRTNLCVSWGAKTQPRLRLDLPFLAGRLQNVNYWVLQHESDPNPSSGYHQDGGQTSRSGPSLYSTRAA